MSDKFSVVPLERLLTMILNEYWETGSIFGISRENFFRPSRKDAFRMTRYGKTLESPSEWRPVPRPDGPKRDCGLADRITLYRTQDGPDLDELEISKPCIDMEDAGYNCEWSQELLLRESIDEYINA